MGNNKSSLPYCLAHLRYVQPNSVHVSLAEQINETNEWNNTPNCRRKWTTATSRYTSLHVVLRWNCVGLERGRTIISKRRERETQWTTYRLRRPRWSCPWVLVRSDSDRDSSSPFRALCCWCSRCGPCRTTRTLHELLSAPVHNHTWKIPGLF